MCCLSTPLPALRICPILRNRPKGSLRGSRPEHRHIYKELFVTHIHETILWGLRGDSGQLFPLWWGMNLRYVQGDDSLVVGQSVRPSIHLLYPPTLAGSRGLVPISSPHWVRGGVHPRQVIMAGIVLYFTPSLNSDQLPCP